MICILFRGKKFVELPYIVKGMDVSFSGILSYVEVRIFLLLGYSLFNRSTQHSLLSGSFVCKSKLLTMCN